MTAEIVMAGASQGGNFDLSIMAMISHAGMIGKLVLLLLLLFSIASWTIIVQKIRLFKVARKENEQFLTIYEKKGNLADLNTTAKNLKNSPIANIFCSGYGELASSVRHASQAKGKSEEAPAKVYLDNLNAVKRSLTRATQREISHFEKSLTFLATTGSSSPFIGLFGTVWGVMLSFQGIGTRGSASIAVVAPGISEALIATAAGLAAAVPAVIFYNHFLNKVRYLSTEIEDFSLDFLNVLEKKFLVK